MLELWAWTHRVTNQAMLTAIFIVLGQDPATATPPPASFTDSWRKVLIDNALALTILFIFLAAIVSVIVNKRRKDKCLKLLHDFHCTYLTTAGKAVWGDLTVYSEGLELSFDAPHTTRRGLVKSSALIYQSEVANCLAVCRVVDGLSDRELADRRLQIKKTFELNPVRRFVRWCRNILATLKDAFNKAMAAIIGAVAKARPGAVASQQSQVTEIGTTLLGAAANAYEPILEAHIGKPVILKLAGPADTPTATALELPGYLVDYTENFVAVFNVDHETIEPVSLSLTESADDPRFGVAFTDRDVTVTAKGPEVVIVKSMSSGSLFHQLCVPLTPGCSVTLRHEPGQEVRLELQITRRLDVVAPRALATIHFGAERESPPRQDWVGVAPQNDAEGAESVTDPEA